jgi:hypothetical protein
MAEPSLTPPAVPRPAATTADVFYRSLDGHRGQVGWRRCFRGIDTLSAMIVVAEIVDLQRFRRPRELMAYRARFQ